MEGFNAAPAAAISVRSLALQTAASDEVQGERLFHVEGGYSRLVETLLTRARAAGAEVSTGVTVETIAWQRGRVQVKARGALAHRLPPLRARQALVTLPLGVLKTQPPSPGAVRFAPALPPDKRRAIQETRVSPVVRVVLRFARSDGGSWSAPGARDFTFLRVPGAPFPALWRTTAPDEPPVVTAWAGGPPADRLAGSSDGDRLRAALVSLGRGLAVSTPRLLDDLAGFRVFDWQVDPFARGAYSFSPPGGLHLPEALGAPVDDTLYFAGEATHPDGATGTVHGALETGERAAAAILR